MDTYIHITCIVVWEYVRLLWHLLNLYILDNPNAAVTGRVVAAGRGPQNNEDTVTGPCHVNANTLSTCQK